MSKTRFIGLGFLAFFLWIKQAYADQDHNMTAIPEWIAQQLSVDLLVGQIIISSILILIWLLPVAWISRGRGSGVPEIACVLLIMTFCISIGWLPYWILVIFCVCIAMMFAGRMRDWITGKGTE